MATLKAMFKLMDGYTSTIDKVNRKTDEATTKILGASRSTDKFNQKLVETSDSANSAAGGLSKFVAVAAMLAAGIKGIGFVDDYTNTSARLSLINDGLQTQADLQDKIFAAANRSKGAYTDMAAAISKMGLLAGDSFKSNDELIAFTELIQKSFKIGGASQTEQQSGLLQLTQAMAAGKLQGDEFRSIMENAPMVAAAIAKFTGKSKGELKDMSKDGTITADVIKNAMFAMGDDINEKFKTMPMTFTDIWNKIKNSATQAFAPIFIDISDFINSSGFLNFINGIINGIYVLAGVVSYISGLIIDNWPIIKTILIGIGIMLAVYVIGYLAAAIPLLISFISMWAAANAPLIMIVATLALMVTALGDAGYTATDVFTAMTGGINVVLQFFKNLGFAIANIALGIGNAIGTLGTNIGIAFQNALSGVQSRWYKMLATALDVIGEIAAALNKLPFVSFDYSGVTSAADKYAAKAAEAAGSKKEYESISDAFNKGYNTLDTFKTGWADDAYKTGEDWGADKVDKLKKAIDKMTGKNKNKDKDKGFDPKDYLNGPITVKGTGKNGSVDVNMEDEDLQYLRDVAEREYINKFSSATLAPNVSIQFGDVHEEADAEKVAGRIKKILQEEIAVLAEGAH